MAHIHYAPPGVPPPKMPTIPIVGIYDSVIANELQACSREMEKALREAPAHSAYNQAKARFEELAGIAAAPKVVLAAAVVPAGSLEEDL